MCDALDSLDLSETDAACCALADDCEAWLVRLGGEIHARILGGEGGDFLWQKSYRTVGWAKRGLRAEVARLGLCGDAPLPTPANDIALDVCEQQEELLERVSAKSIWVQQCVRKDGVMTRGDVHIPVVLESRDGRHEFRFTVGDREFAADFESEREALERGVAKVKGLLDWATV